MLLRGIGDIEDDLEGDDTLTPSFVTPEKSDVFPVTSPANAAANGGGSSSWWDTISKALGNVLKPVASGVTATATGQAAALAQARAAADQTQTYLLLGGAAALVTTIVLVRRNRRKT